ncbi:hypothetical protein L0337_33720 [candidate division KSB1 bacterium]|nr:hypothetical protein [candidate division KSB1 bacterium]
MYKTIDKLVEICKRHIIVSDTGVVISEPYIPYFPDAWNGILVLAEAQNLSRSNSAYVNELKNLSSDERIKRLYRSNGVGDLGIAPWDDASLKLAVESVFDAKAENTAASNAVLWSQVTTTKNNTNPSNELIERSIKLWIELIPIIKLDHVITAGSIAQQVITRTKQAISGSWKHTSFRLPARTAMSRISGLFRDTDLLKRYPEVASVLEKHPEWIPKKYRQNKIFFACHAVSVASGD